MPNLWQIPISSHLTVLQGSTRGSTAISAPTSSRRLLCQHRTTWRLDGMVRLSQLSLEIALGFLQLAVLLFLLGLGGVRAYIVWRILGCILVVALFLRCSSLLGVGLSPVSRRCPPHLLLGLLRSPRIPLPRGILGILGFPQS